MSTQVVGPFEEIEEQRGRWIHRTFFYYEIDFHERMSPGCALQACMDGSRRKSLRLLRLRLLSLFLQRVKQVINKTLQFLRDLDFFVL